MKQSKYTREKILFRFVGLLSYTRRNSLFTSQTYSILNLHDFDCQDGLMHAIYYRCSSSLSSVNENISL